MATFRGSNHQMAASSVWTNGDLANLIDNLFRQSIRAGARGDYERGLRDMAQAIADATNTEIALPPSTLPAQATASPSAVAERYERIEERYERIEERYERIEERYERYTPPPTVPERRFAIRGEREEWPAAPQSTPVHTVHANAAPVDMTGDDVNITLFNTAKGRLVSREIGHGWIGNDGYTAYWNAADWLRITVDEARSWGNLVPDDWAVLVRPAYAAAQRRQLAGPHHASRITQNNRSHQ